MVYYVLVFGANVGHNVLIEEFEYEWDAVCKYQVLRHELELVNMIHFQVLQEKQQDGGYGFYQDFLVSIHVNTQFHRL